MDGARRRGGVHGYLVELALAAVAVVVHGREHHRVLAVGYLLALVRAPVPAQLGRDLDALLLVGQPVEESLHTLVLRAFLLVENLAHRGALGVGYPEGIPLNVALVVYADGQDQFIVLAVCVGRQIILTVGALRVGDLDARGLTIHHAQGHDRPGPEGPGAAVEGSGRDGGSELAGIPALLGEEGILVLGCGDREGEAQGEGGQEAGSPPLGQLDGVYAPTHGQGGGLLKGKGQAGIENKILEEWEGQIGRHRKAQDVGLEEVESGPGLEGEGGREGMFQVGAACGALGPQGSVPLAQAGGHKAPAEVLHEAQIARGMHEADVGPQGPIESGAGAQGRLEAYAQPEILVEVLSECPTQVENVAQGHAGQSGRNVDIAQARAPDSYRAGYGC